MKDHSGAIRMGAALLLVAALSLGACAPQAAQPEGPPKVRVCYSALAATQLPVLYAQERGLFAEQGLDVELTYFPSGTAAATAMIAGEQDLCQIAGSSVVNAAVAGEDLVLIAGLFNTYVYSLIVQPEIERPEDLIGGSLAVSRVGSSSDAAVRIALHSMGLVPDEDVAILAIGDQSARITALETGEISGTVASIPESTRAKQAGFRELLDMSTLGAPFQHTAIATSRSYLADHRPQAVAFMKALLIAIDQMKRDRAGTIAVMASSLELDPEMQGDLLSAAYDELIPVYLPDEPYPSLEGIQTLLDNLEAENPTAADVRPQDLVDQSILEEALQDSGSS